MRKEVLKIRDSLCEDYEGTCICNTDFTEEGINKEINKIISPDDISEEERKYIVNFLNEELFVCSYCGYITPSCEKCEGNICTDCEDSYIDECSNCGKIVDARVDMVHYDHPEYDFLCDDCFNKIEGGEDYDS